MRSIAGLIVWIFFFCINPLQAQRTHYAIIKGSVIDSSSRQFLEAATVSVFLVADSSLVNYSITNKKGEFLIKDIPQATPCRLLVSYSGLNSYMQEFIIAPETKVLIINTIQLQKKQVEMEEVIVSAQRPPVIIKKDTIEFNAGSFKTPVNGVVEDLLRLLPGLEVDEKGNISINGKRVSKITVDGKDFFGSDFKIASKNLPRDMIDKVQVLDYKSREARFNKTTSTNEEKAINLILKKDKKRGLVGRGSAGYGSDKRYESGTSLNYLSGPLQLNFIGSINNTNRLASSASDVSVSNLDGSFGGKGITETKAAGLNFGNEFGEKWRVNSSYFYNNSRTTNTTSVRRQNILPDTTFFYNAVNQSTNNNDNHQVNLGINYRPDSASELNVNAAYTAVTGTAVIANNAVSSNARGETINVANNLFTSQPDDKNTDLEVFFGRQLKKMGRAFSLSVNYNDRNRRSFDTNAGNTIFYRPDGSSTEDKVDQQSNTKEESKLLNLLATFTEPLSQTISIVLSYNYSSGNGLTDKITDRFNPLTAQYEKDTLFSNSLSNRHLAHAPNWSINYSSSKINATVGATVQWLKQENVVEQAKYSAKQNFTNLFPSVNLNYKFSKTGNMTFNYYGRSQQPSIEQLQPVPDNRNALYIRLGNPELKPSFLHRIQVNLQQYNSKANWNLGLALSKVHNQIVDDTWFDTVQISRPVNSNGNYNLSFNMGFSRNWKKKNWSLRLSLYSNGGYKKNVSFSNKVENITKSYSIASRIGLTYTYKELLTLMPVFITHYLDNRYSIQQIQQAENITQTLAVNVLMNWPKRLILENNIQYNYNSRTAPSFPKGVTLWNVAINYHFFKDRQAILRLSVFDLLKQNTSINRNLTPTYIEDSEVRVLQQYFLVSFIYNLKQLGK